MEHRTKWEADTLALLRSWGFVFLAVGHNYGISDNGMYIEVRCDQCGAVSYAVLLKILLRADVAEINADVRRHTYYKTGHVCGLRNS